MCTRSRWRQPGVVEIIMLVIIITVAAVTIIGCFLHALHYSKHFTDPNLYNNSAT